MRAACLAATLFVVPAAASDWSGAYIGLHTGYAAASHEVEGAGGGFGYSFTFAYEIEPCAGIAGVQTGYLYQTGNIVLGIEGAASFADLGERLGPIVGTGTNLDYASFRAEWFASLRAKAGIALEGGVLLYASGGVAFSDWRETSGASGAPYASVETSRTGWVAGFGAAFDLGGGWFGSVAYDHYGFGEIERAGWGSDSHLTAATSFDTVTLGLNYRF